jgi:hypothetical protein
MAEKIKVSLSTMLKVLAEQLPTILVNASDSINIMLKDRIVLEKIQASATIFADAITTANKTMHELGVKLDADLRSYNDDVLKDFAIRNVKDAVLLKMNSRAITKSINVIKETLNINKPVVKETTVGIQTEVENGIIRDAHNEQINILKNQCVDNNNTFSICPLDKVITMLGNNVEHNDAYHYMMTFHCAEWKGIGLTKQMVAYVFNNIRDHRKMPRLLDMLTCK